MLDEGGEKDPQPKPKADRKPAASKAKAKSKVAPEPCKSKVAPEPPKGGGQILQQKALEFGNVEESDANNKFRNRWDDGTESLETSNVMKLRTDVGAMP
eukprot:jgi/Tetstr1/439787/TSEL_028200.t1